MSNGSLNTKVLHNVLIQENGIIRNGDNGFLLGRLAGGQKFEHIREKPVSLLVAVDALVTAITNGQKIDCEDWQKKMIKLWLEKKND